MVGNTDNLEAFLQFEVVRISNPFLPVLGVYLASFSHIAQRGI